MMVTCRSCKKKVDKNEAICVQKGGKNVYYCSQECLDKANFKPTKDTSWRDLMDLIKDLYESVGETPNYPMITKQIKNLQSDIAYYDDNGTPQTFKTKGMIMTLLYARELGKMFEPKYGVIFLFNKYYNEARMDYIYKYKMKNVIENFDLEDEIKVIVRKIKEDDYDDF